MKKQSGIKVKNMPVRVKDIIKRLENDGWYPVRQKGSHRQFKHPLKKGLVTVSCHKLSDELAPGTLSSILKQAQLKTEAE